MPESLFTYGTLRDPKVQEKVFGRITNGKPDSLDDYRRSELELIGEVYPVIISSNGDSVDGLVIEVSTSELDKIDEYETDAYRRIKVKLKSGLEAWVYEKNEMVAG